MIGQVIGDIRIDRELGRGGMGAVYQGLDLMLERRVAVKVVHPELGQDPVLAERFQKEARALARLNHPNVTSVYSFFRQGEQFYLVMEFVEGEPLDERLAGGRALPWPEAAELMSAALDGLQHAHDQGIIHRDLKPSNLLLTPAGGIKIMDFGIAHILGQKRLTRMGSVVGTIEYMSPEQVGGRELDARTDLYSLGVVLYETVTGRAPFSADTDFELMRAQLETMPEPPRTLAPELPEGLERAIVRALAKDPGERFQTATDFAATLRQGLGESGMAAGEPAVATLAAAPVPAPAPLTPPAAAAAPDSVTARISRFVRPRMIPLASLGLLTVAAVVLALALFGPGSGSTADSPRAAAPPSSRQPAEIASRQLAAPPATAPPATAPPVAAGASSPPVSTPKPPPASPPPPSPPPRPAPSPPPPPAPSPPPPAPSPPPPAPSPPPAAAEESPVQPAAESAEPAEPAAEPAAVEKQPLNPVDPDTALAQLAPLAEQLQLDSNRFLESYEEFEDDEDRWPAASASRVEQLLVEVEALEEATNRLQRACDAVADREGADTQASRRRMFRKIKAKVTRVTGLTPADRASLWRQADDAVATGRRVTELMAQVEIDDVVLFTWRPVRDGLAQLERLSRAATR